MEKWFKGHTLLVFVVGIMSSVVTYAATAIFMGFTTFATQKMVDDKIAEVKATQEKSHAEVREQLTIIQSDIKTLLQRR